MDLNAALGNLSSPNPALRNPAEAQLAQAAETQYGPFVLALCTELANESSAEGSRQQAGLYMKNMLTAKDSAISEQKTAKWNQCDASIRAQVRTLCLQSVHSPVKSVSHTAAQVLASIAAIDVPTGQWPELLPSLFNNVSSTEVTMTAKVHSLEALGYMCEAMDPDQVEKSVVDQLLNTIVDGMRADRPNEMKLAGVTAMLNSLNFTEANFEVQGERDAIVNAICSAAQCDDIHVRIKAFECLATIASYYYGQLPAYITNLFNLTVNAIQSDAPEVGQQAIEFWSTICDTEVDLACDAAIGRELEEGVVYYKIIEQAAAALVPVILKTLSRQSDDHDEDSWNIAKAGAACLEALAQVLCDNIVNLVIPFVTANIQSPEWRMKEAAIMAFGMVLDGPSSQQILPIVAGALPVLVSCIQDSSTHVKDTSAWVIGRICEFHSEAITPAIFPQMVQALSLALEDPVASVSAQACYALHNLAQACSAESEHATNVLSNFMPVMLQKLLNVVNREDWDEANLRSIAYEAVNQMVENSAVDMLPVVNQVLIEAIARLKGTFTGNYDVQERMNLQSHLCSLIGVCVQKLPDDQVKAQADAIMELVLQVFNAKGAVAHEDAFLAIGYLSTKLDAEFGTRYAAYLMPPLLAGLRNTEEHSVCTVAIGVAGDMCRAMGGGIGPYADDIMRATLEILQSQTVNRAVKPHSISLFADVAFAIEGDFEKYCSFVLPMLAQAGGVEIDADCDDEDQIDYINTLRESILEAYTGIVQGLREGKKENAVVPGIEQIVNLIQRATSDPHCGVEVLKGAIGLLGDLGATYGARMYQIYSQPYIAQLMQEGRQHEYMSQIVNYTHGIIQQVRAGK